MADLTVPLGLAYSAVVTMAVVPIWVGSHLGISNIVKVNSEKSGTKSSSSVELQVSLFHHHLENHFEFSNPKI